MLRALASRAPGASRTSIGTVAKTDNRRLGLQVGSPVLLELAGCYRFATARAAYAVVAEVQRQLGERRERGGWYRVSPQEVAEAIGSHSASTIRLANRPP